MTARILVVEDDSIVRASIADTVKQDGYDVEEARDGAEAAALFDQRHFDLVITDFVMPQLNGLKVIARIHSVSPRTPIILVTGYLSGGTGKALVEGMAELIVKPIQLEELSSTVKRLLQAKDPSTTVYRRNKDHQTWHFRIGCSKWPTDKYDEQEALPTDGQLCNECKSMQAAP